MAEERIEIKAKPELLARLLCNATHPLALSLGTAAPGEPCCRYCLLYPPAEEG